MKQALTIAGYDSNGSAGLAADLHTFFADGVYGEGVLTGAVAENTVAITAGHRLPLDFIQAEFNDLAEFNIGATKTGMLATADIINCVVANYDFAKFGPLVVDPVIVTKRKDLMLSKDALATLKQRLIPLATVITPNAAEAEVLTGRPVNNHDDMQSAAVCLQHMGAKNVVIKGPHEPDAQSLLHNYVLLADGQDFWMDHGFVNTLKLNGAGDSFSALITAELAKGSPIDKAIKKADRFVDAAIHHPLSIGKRIGPINHWAGQTVL